MTNIEIKAIDYLADIVIHKRNPSGAYSGGTRLCDLPDQDLPHLPRYSKEYYRKLVRQHIKEHPNDEFSDLVNWAGQGGGKDD